MHTGYLAVLSFIILQFFIAFFLILINQYFITEMLMEMFLEELIDIRLLF